MTDRGRFEVHYPNGMRRRVDTPQEAFVLHYLPAVLERFYQESALLRLLRTPVVPPPGRSYTFPVAT